MASELRQNSPYKMARRSATDINELNKLMEKLKERPINNANSYISSKERLVLANFLSDLRTVMVETRSIFSEETPQKVSTLRSDLRNSNQERDELQLEIQRLLDQLDGFVQALMNEEDNGDLVPYMEALKL